MKNKVKIILELLYIFTLMLFVYRIFWAFYSCPFFTLSKFLECNAEIFLDDFFSTKYDGSWLHQEYPIRFYRGLAFCLVMTFILTAGYFYTLKFIFCSIYKKLYKNFMLIIFPLALILINLTPLGYIYVDMVIKFFLLGGI